MFILELFKSLLFGVVEGITEWLPISWTGHLILLDECIQLHVSTEFMDMYRYVIQLGAILAVLLLFHKLNPFSPRKNTVQRTQDLDALGKGRAGLYPLSRHRTASERLDGRPPDDTLGSGRRPDRLRRGLPGH